MTEEVESTPGVTAELQAYMDDGDVHIADMAEQVRQIYRAKQQGALNESEFQELVGDCLDVARIDELADNIERKAHIEVAAKAIAKIVGMIL